MRQLFSVLATVALVGCGDGSGPSDVIPAELAGEWLAAPSCLPQGCNFMFIPVANPSNSINIVQLAGISMELTLNRSGGFQLLARPGGIPPVTGTARVEGQMLIVRDGTAVDTLDYQLQQGELTLNFRGTFAFDFDSDGATEAARVQGRFHRR